MWQPTTVTPEPGKKLVAIYGDGSGAILLYRHDGGYIDAEGVDCDEDWFRLHPGLWAYLPNDLEFWCESGDEPIHLPT